MTKQTIRTMTAVALFCCSGLAAFAQVVFAGTYSNIRYTTEHESGYQVQLWKCNGQVYGFLTVANGMQGDVPVGVIDHVTFDAATGKLSFTAKLTTGSDVVGPGVTQVDAKDLFKFDGMLTSKLLSGKLTHEDQATPEVPATTVPLRLALIKDKPTPDHYATPADLLAANQPMLDDSGPKW